MAWLQFNGTNATGASDLFIYVNDASNGIFSIGLFLVLFVMLFVFLKTSGEDVASCMMYSSFVCFVLSVLAWGVGFATKPIIIVLLPLLILSIVFRAATR